MSSTVWIMLFVLGTAVSLASSYVLVTRLERLGERAGMSEALLGMVAALAADAPEIIGHSSCYMGLGDDDERNGGVPGAARGELYGGGGLAAGYLNDPEPTAERFVEAHVDGAGSVRLYRTGDIVELRTDGALEFLGHRDSRSGARAPRGARTGRGRVVREPHYRAGRGPLRAGPRPPHRACHRPRRTAVRDHGGARAVLRGRCRSR